MAYFFCVFSILHLDGFTRADKINYRYQIHSNIVEALNQLIEACQKFRIVHESAIQVVAFSL